jgi:hypothetical protein
MAANPIYLVMDAARPVAAFTARHDLKAYLTRLPPPRMGLRRLTDSL